jgi:hypothetical protein
LHYVWFYEGAQIKQKLYAAAALAIVFAIVMFPLWPMKMRLGVWYLSMGMLGLIFRLILFAITYFAVSPGLWLYPRLFEDIGFFESFVPLWGWHEVGPLSLYAFSRNDTNEMNRRRRKRRRRLPRDLQMLELPWQL